MFGLFKNPDDDPTSVSPENKGKPFRLACKMWGGNVDVYAVYEDGGHDRIAEFANLDLFDLFCDGLHIIDLRTGEKYRKSTSYEEIANKPGLKVVK